MENNEKMLTSKVVPKSTKKNGSLKNQSLICLNDMIFWLFILISSTLGGVLITKRPENLKIIKIAALFLNFYYFIKKYIRKNGK